MNERYPDDATLLALEADTHTGVEFIRTGQSPYFLEFRRMLHRLLEATRRANDLRVYQEDDLTIGIRSGRCVIHDAAISFTGQSGLAVANNATTHVWLDAAGLLQIGTDGLPTTRADFVPLAQVESAAGAITTITDLRGEAFLAAWNLAMLGVQASTETVNAVLGEVEPTVTSAALNTLTAGSDSLADAHHQHSQYGRDSDFMEQFILANQNDGTDANMALAFSLPGRLAYPTRLFADAGAGWLKQQHGSAERALVGAVQVSFAHEGSLNAAQSGKLMGMVPVDGEIVAVIVSARANLETSDAADSVDAIVKVNGNNVTVTHPQLRTQDGTGFRSTGQGDGIAAAIKSDGTEHVQRGDIVTLDVTRTVNGAVTNDATDLVVMVVVRAAAPE
ncbi:MAG: hypothetical protein WD294_10430 [Phycisphaeraceae bacterium]